jgi:hypothetical protein
MALNNRFIERLKLRQKAFRGQRNYSRSPYSVRLRLAYVRKEPEGWPLKRPATPAEWAHAQKVMIMRRVPKMGPIHRDKLIGYVSSDLMAASDAGRIYVDSNFMAMRNLGLELERMCVKDETLRSAPVMEDPEMPRPAPAIYRTEYADGWLQRVPVVVSAIVDFLPTTSLLDMMVQALIDDDLNVSEPVEDGDILGGGSGD